MEPTKAEMNFPRQPLPVSVLIGGDPIDINSWMQRLRLAAEASGDQTQRTAYNEFKIYPRAVND